jgi:tetratricopeptide (TPR) repeat protein
VIISTTIPNSRADVIGAALATIEPEVDVCMVIDTGATDDTMKIAADVLGPKLVVRRWPWQNDFAAARNYALDEARQVIMGAYRDDWAPTDWIITADTDEWLRIPGARSFLASVPADRDVVVVPHSTGTYRQARCLRATTQARWHAPVHEYLTPYRSVEAPAGWSFQCQPRPQEDRTEKYTRYAAILESEIQRRPDDARSWYYLGDCYAILGYKGKAIQAFRTCGELPGWAEQAAWGYWRAALLQLELGLPELALESAKAGAARAPQCGELFYLTGWIYGERLGDWGGAATYASLALSCRTGPRPGFCFPPAQRELPRQLLEQAERQLNAAPPASELRAVETPPADGTPPDR